MKSILYNLETVPDMVCLTDENTREVMEYAVPLLTNREQSLCTKPWLGPNCTRLKQLHTIKVSTTSLPVVVPFSASKFDYRERSLT